MGRKATSIYHRSNNGDETTQRNESNSSYFIKPVTYMNIYILIFAFLAWWIIGSISFVYWWRKDFDFTTDELFLAFASGIPGPISFVMGWWAQSKPRSYVILRKKR